MEICSEAGKTLFRPGFLNFHHIRLPRGHRPNASHSKATAKAHLLHSEGHWSGSLQAGEAVLHLVLHISKADDGSFRATIDSLDQGVYGIEATPLEQKDSALRFNVPSVGASYEGKFSLDRRRMKASGRRVL